MDIQGRFVGCDGPISPSDQNQFNLGKFRGDIPLPDQYVVFTAETVPIAR